MGKKRGPSHHRRSGCSSEPLPPVPHFIKLALPSAIEAKVLRIPNKFIETHGFDFSDIATLRVPNGREWRIEVKRGMSDVWFQHGWHDFVVHHSIRQWDFLVFRYEGNSKFQVLIFDQSGCEIDYLRDHIGTSNTGFEDEGTGMRERVSQMLRYQRYIAASFEGRKCRREVKKEPHEVIELDSSDSEMNRRRKCETSTAKSVGREDLGSKRSNFERTEGFQVMRVRSNIIAHAAMNSTSNQPSDGKEIIASTRNFPDKKSMESAMCEAGKLNLKNPSFLIILKGYHFENYSVSVPAEFARRYMTEATEFINVEDPEGRQWPIHVLKEGSILGRGWCELFGGNDYLKEGDTCVFELKETKPSIELKLWVIDPLYK